MNQQSEVIESQIENYFKMAQFLFLRGQYDNSADKFEKVCSLAKMYLKNQDKYPFPIEILLDSIYKLGEIYEKKQMFDKSYQFYLIRNSFIEFLLSNRNLFDSNTRLFILPQINSEKCADKSTMQNLVKVRNDFLTLFHELGKTYKMKSQSFSLEDHAKLIKAVKETNQLQKMQERKDVANVFIDATKQMKIEQNKSFVHSFFNFLDDTSHLLFVLVLIAAVIIISVVIYIINLKSKTSTHTKVYSKKETSTKLYPDISHFQKQILDHKKSEEYIKRFLEKNRNHNDNL